MPVIQETLAKPYTLQQLLDRQVEKYGPDLAFHIHVPKASGGTVNALFRQNNFFALNFNMNTRSFFDVVSEERFLSRCRQPAPRAPYLLTGHFRLDHPFVKSAWMPHVIVTTLRHPVQRMLSYYNYALRLPGNPWHEEIVKGMRFVEYARNANAAFGPQYSYFDDTGEGSFAPTGTASAQQCLNNLVTRVGLLGLTERFDEFTVLMGYLLGRGRILAVPSGNVTSRIPTSIELPPKTTLDPDEQDTITELLKDDIWFYEEAVKEYDRRLRDARLQAILAEALPLVHASQEYTLRLQAIRDPGNRARKAFDRIDAQP
jgi:hypothetical protein